MAFSASQRRRTLKGLATLPVAALLLVVNPLQAGAAPAGNNGTVKVDGIEFDQHPNNEPHVTCDFQIDFYGFDQGAATVTFVAQAPTGKDGESLKTDTVTWGADRRGGSEAGLNAERVYNLSQALSSYTPHPKQGYHVKLTVNAPGAQGADTKHKVFWVEPCATDTKGSDGEIIKTPPPGGDDKIIPAGTTKTPGTPATPATPDTPAAGPDTVVAGETLTNNPAPAASARPDVSIEGNNLVKTDGTAPAAPAAALATTGTSVGPSLLLAAIALTLGSVMRYFGKKKPALAPS